MAKLKLSENLFLEVAELNRFRQFIEDDGWKRVIKSIIKSYRMKKVGVTWISQISNKYMLWNERDTGK